MSQHTRPLNRQDYKTLTLAALGGALEFYDFIIFVFFAAVVGELFFPADIPEWLRQVQTFGIFAAGYLARPLGGIIMAHFGDLVGRKKMFTLSILLMAVPTLAIGLLPILIPGVYGNFPPNVRLLLGNGVAMGALSAAVMNLIFYHIAPEKKTDENFIYVSHFASLNNRTVRNYSFCYDKTLHVAHWVAYPLHSVYRGSIDRTDDFQYDPKVDYSWQPNLAAGSYRGSYDRGHQLPSADRTATRELNLQTFYATNMTPQLNRLNQDMWANLEAKVRAQICNDTLYVVTGCYYANTNTTTTDRDGKVCPVPTNYFKVLLRTRTGTTGKRIADCSADELKAIGFWVDQKSYGDIQPPASICMSVAEIEKKTGFTFFPNIPESAAESVKAQNSPSQWGIQN